MSIFGKIKDAIFGRPAQARETPAPKPMPMPTGNAYADAPIVAPTQPAQTTLFNVENSLDSMPGADRLNWRTSIVDLMKLIGVDSDYESRKALATEMGRDDYKGDVEDNVWLHQRVMQELANNGGQVPESLR